MTKIAELNYGDTVNLFEGMSEDTYGHATVTQITDEEVVLTRPYLHTSDVIYTGGIISYMGWEVCRYRKDDLRFDFRVIRPGKGIR